ncbi:13414_t:CDS:2 [Gigaspora margarita]|uniref:13414_t:CDS:1 n=1 Tax=Gigaspora margarita TaxID=4874 RepID=A0ABN7VYZ0_GIGMA|nr:13414_t:CDS:2 [Gigaspora margarita]
MLVDVETIKVNLSKTPIELDGYGIQNESEEGDFTLKRNETTCLRIEESPKPLSFYKKENYIANPTLMEIDPNKDSSEINMKINPMQEDEIAVPGKQTRNWPIISRILKEKIKKSLTLWDISNETLACQIRKNLSFYGRLTVKSFRANSKSKAAFVEIEFKNEKQVKRIVTGSNAIKIINRRGFSSSGDNTHFEEFKLIKNLFVGLKGKAKIEIKSDKNYPKIALLQKVPQINVLLQEILKRLEIVENNQSVLLVTNKVNLSTRSLAYSCS